jgi:hypothetical protein
LEVSLAVTAGGEGTAALMSELSKPVDLGFAQREQALLDLLLDHGDATIS